MDEPYTVVPLSRMRKVIATRMVEAKRTIPHFRVIADIEMDAVLAWRQQVNAEHPHSRISVNDCIIKACAQALMEQPALNTQWNGEEIHQYHDAHISVVVAVEGGLLTPVIRHANRKSVRDIADEMRTLTARAAKGQLKMNEILGGSFTISNLGGYGVDQFDAIINPPQCAILAVGRAKPQMTVSDSGEARIATVLRATLSVDHRAVDGATAGAFMSALRRRLEEPGHLNGVGDD